MKITILSVAILGLAAVSSQAAVTFSAISQNNDGSTTTTTLQDRGPGSRGSTQSLAGTAVTESTPYTSFAFDLTLTGAAGSPTPGSGQASLTFTVSAPVNYSNASADTFFRTDGSPAPVVGSSGTLDAGDYFMTTSVSGSASANDVGTLSLTISPIPEPSTALLGLLGMLGLLRRRR